MKLTTSRIRRSLRDIDGITRELGLGRAVHYRARGGACEIDRSASVAKSATLEWSCRYGRSTRQLNSLHDLWKAQYARGEERL